MVDDPHAGFLRLLIAEQGILRAYLLAATRDAQVADELLQDVSVSLFTAFARYDRERPFRPWALGVARLHVLRWRRDRMRQPTLLSEEALELLAETAAEEAPEIDRRVGQLRTCIEDLAGRPRELLRWRYAEGLPIAEIAHRLGRQVAAIEMALTRLRRGLRQCIERRAQEGAR